MAKQLSFEPERIKKVPLSAVTPNSWNPKQEDTEEFRNVRRSIELYGLKGAILVREAAPDSGFTHEIIDGEQRYRAAKELGFDELYVYDLGKVIDKEAKAMTIWWEVQVPFDRPELAKLVVELDDTRVTLPYVGAELKGLRELAGFKFEKEERLDSRTTPAQDREYRIFTCKLRKEQYETLMEAFEAIKEMEDFDHATCLTTLAEEYLAR